MSDLIVEFAKRLSKKDDATKVKTKISKHVSTTFLEVTEKAEIKLGKEKGAYYTIEFPFDPVMQLVEKKTILHEATKAITQVIQKCEIDKLSKVLVVGLGNPKMVADCFGPRTCERILVTRHVTKSGHYPDNLCEVSCLSTNVFGKTGLESFEIVNGVVREIKPDLVILLDTLVACSVKRLCTNIQIANVGIVPGSGVDNARKELSKKSLQVPVVTIGVPFVVYADSFCNEEAKKLINRLTEKNFTKDFEFKSLKDLIVMPREIEQQVRFCCDVVASAINNALNPNFSVNDIETFFV